MIIVKITVLLILITAFYLLAIRVWFEANPPKAIVANISNKHPKWMVSGI